MSSSQFNGVRWVHDAHFGIRKILRTRVQPHATDLSRPLVSCNERGDTLIEVLIALVVIGLTVAALLGAFATSVIASGEQRGLATTDTVLKSYVEAAIFQIESQEFSSTNGTYPIFYGCESPSTLANYYTNGLKTGLGNGGIVYYSPPSGYSASIQNVQFWDGNQFGSSCATGSLNPEELQAVVQAPNGTTASLYFVVSNPKVPQGAASQMIVSTQPPATATAGTTFPISIVIEDSLGHIVTNSSASVTLAITAGTGTSGAVLSCSSDPVTVTNGYANFSCSINLSGNGYTLTATSTGLSPDTTSSINVSPGSASQLAFAPTNPAQWSAVAGSPIPTIAVQVEDAEGNIVTSASGSIVMSIGTGSAQATFTTPPSVTSVPLTNGVANFANDLEVTNPGTYTFTATPSGVSGLNASDAITSASFNIPAGPNTLFLRFTAQPSGGANGQVWATQPQVSIVDGLGVVQTANATPITISIFSSPGNGGSLSSCLPTGTTITPTNGVASFSGCYITGTAGAYVLNASAPGIASVQSNSFTISPGTASKLVFTTQPDGGHNQQAWATQPVVTVEDSSGNKATNYSGSVTLELYNDLSGSTFNCTTNPVSVSSGVATFSGCQIKKGSGGNGNGSPYILQATSGTLSPAFSNGITIT